MVVGEKTKLTYEDYAKTPEWERYELIDGELIELTSPRIAHQLLLGVLHSEVRAFVREHMLGRVFMSPTDLVLDDTNTFQPDLFFVSNERADIITPENIQGAPDMVVEILSPSTQRRDWGIKRDLYAEHGVKEYWVASTDEERIWVLLLGENGLYVVTAVYERGDTLTSPTLAGFSLSLNAVFEEVFE